MRVFFYRESVNACSYYRCILPHKYLSRDPEITSKISDSLTEQDIEESDIFIFQKKHSSNDFALLNKIKAFGKKIVYEIDDNIFDVPIWNPSYAAINQIKAKIKYFIEKVDLVTVTCKHLRKELLRFNKNIAVLPNSLDFEKIDRGETIKPQILNKNLQQVDWEELKGKLKGKIIIGWSGSPTHKEDLKIVTKPLLRLLSQNKNIVLFMVLGAIKELVIRSPEDQIFCVGAVKLEDYYALLRTLNWDIGLAPLDFSNFNNSKSNLKILEYMSLGIIPVATKIENYANTLEIRFNNLLINANNKSLWFDKINELSQSNLTVLRDKVISFTKENYDIKNNIELWKSTYRKLLES